MGYRLTGMTIAEEKVKQSDKRQGGETRNVFEEREDEGQKLKAESRVPRANRDCYKKE